VEVNVINVKIHIMVFSLRRSKLKHVMGHALCPAARNRQLYDVHSADMEKSHGFVAIMTASNMPPGIFMIVKSSCQECRFQSLQAQKSVMVSS